MILLLAPLGGALIRLAGPRLLRQSDTIPGDDESARERGDLAWDDTVDLSRGQGKVKLIFDAQGMVEITTERETVT